MIAHLLEVCIAIMIMKDLVERFVMNVRHFKESRTGKIDRVAKEMESRRCRWTTFNRLFGLARV